MTYFLQYEPVITPGNEAIVHHIEVFECSPQMDTVPQFSGSCDSKMKPQTQLLPTRSGAWAMGAEVCELLHTAFTVHSTELKWQLIHKWK